MSGGPAVSAAFRGPLSWPPPLSGGGFFLSVIEGALLDQPLNYRVFQRCRDLTRKSTLSLILSDDQSRLARSMR